MSFHYAIDDAMLISLMLMLAPRLPHAACYYCHGRRCAIVAMPRHYAAAAAMPLSSFHTFMR